MAERKGAPAAPRRTDRRLLSAALAPRTVATYSAAVRRFLRWVADTNAAAFDDDDFTYDDLDYLLVDFFHDSYDRGFGKTVGAATLNGVAHFLPAARDRLPDAHMAVRGWNRIQPPVSYPPISWPLACTVALQMFRHGLDWHRDAVGALVAFTCLLRVGELVGLRREHVHDSQDPDQQHLHDRLFDGIVLVLPKTKTGPNQWVTMEAGLVRDWLRALRNDTAPGARIFPSSARTFRRRFEHACHELRLVGRYVPHSLRHGGATFRLLRGASIEDVMLKGRWAVSKSARTYLQAGRASLLQQSVPPAVAAAATAISADLAAAFALVREHHARH